MSNNQHLTQDELAFEVWEDESPVTPEVARTRTEHDSLGEIEVPADHYWGAQTQRSRYNFKIGADRMPLAVIYAMAQVKVAAAMANRDLGQLSQTKADTIIAVANEILAGELDDEFPLAVFQTGSGTQTNANLNEVIANRGNEVLGEPLLHPSDDVNASQSTNDTFVTAMHVAAYHATIQSAIPSLTALRDSLGAKARAWTEVVKVGRTHLMDATPLTVGQEWSGYEAALGASILRLQQAAAELLEVALGGTAVGTGLNTPAGYREAAVAALAQVTGHPFVPTANPFAAQATLDPLVGAHAALKGVAVALFKIANDIRWAASGPRAGLAELLIPANEPGSTIMPGKTNPTQAEAVLMVCLSVIGRDVTVSMAGAEGNFELNAFRPLVIDEYLRSARLLHEACDSLRLHLVQGSELNEARLHEYVAGSVMVVTALTPAIGYELSARISRLAIDEGISVRDAAERCGVDPHLVDDLTKAAFQQTGLPR